MDAIARPRLVGRVSDGARAGARITAVHAPAGFGKTVLIRQWIAAVPVPVAWLTVDRSDDEPGRFGFRLAEAMGHLDQRVGRDVIAVARTGSALDLVAVVAGLVRDVEGWAGSAVLVVDDLHVLQDPAILHAVVQLVSGLPQRVHVVLISRVREVVPLARLRAMGLVADVGPADLLFTEEEVDYYLRGRAEPAACDAARVMERTGGWPLGVALAARAPVQQQVAHPTGAEASAVGPTVGSEPTRDYLVQEVLSGLDAPVRSFAVATCELNALSASLCESVTGRADCDQMLDLLLRGELLLEPTRPPSSLARGSPAAGGPWYRYRPVFAEALCSIGRSATPSDVRRARHRRASGWYARVEMADEAIAHAVRADDLGRATTLIAAHAMGRLRRWDVHSVRQWADQIPPPTLRACAGAAEAVAWMHVLLGEHVAAERLLGDDAPGPHSQGRISRASTASEAARLALHSLAASGRGQASRAVELAARARACPAPVSQEVVDLPLLAEASAARLNGDRDRAIAAYATLLEDAGDPVAGAMGSAGLGLLWLEAGRLHHAHEVAATALRVLEQSGALPPLAAALYGEMAEAELQWHRLDRAEELSARAAGVATLMGHADARIHHAVVRSRLRLMDGDVPGAREEADRAARLVGPSSPSAAHLYVAVQRVRVLLAGGEPAAARAVLAACGAPAIDAAGSDAWQADDRPPSPPVERARLAWASAVLDQARHARSANCATTAAIAAGLVHDRAAAGGLVPLAVEALLVRARARTTAGDPSGAHVDVIRALELGTAERFVTVFIEAGHVIARLLGDALAAGELDPPGRTHAASILTAFRSHGYTPGERTEPRDALTGAEVRVLAELARGRSYEQTASALFISINTVRTHVRAIYRKLDATNRVQAIERARAQGLL